MKPLAVLVLGVMMLVVAGTAGAQDDNTTKIVGKWKLTKVGREGAADAAPLVTIFNFSKDGKVNVTLKADGLNVTISGTYKIDAKTLIVTFKNGDVEVKEKATVLKLDGSTLEIEDKDKKVDVLSREK